MKNIPCFSPKWYIDLDMKTEWGLSEGRDETWRRKGERQERVSGGSKYSHKHVWPPLLSMLTGKCILEKTTLFINLFIPF